MGHISKLLFTLALALSTQALANQQETPPHAEMIITEFCKVKVCNKLQRVTLDPWKWAKDQMGEHCFYTTMPKSDAIVGKVLDSQSRWYQGSFNPTKRSVTKIKEVGNCHQTTIPSM